MRSVFPGRLSLLLGATVLVCSAQYAAGIHIRVHINPPHINPPHINPPSIPHVNVGPVAITPVGIVPKQAVPAINKGAQETTKAGGAVVKAATAPAAQLVGVIAGKESLNEAGRAAIKSEGGAIVSVATAVSQINESASNLKIVAAQTIAGNVGKTVMTIIDGPTRISVEIATTTAIEAGEIVQGMPADRMIAEPLAAAIRAANLQYAPSARPIPEDVKVLLSSFYPADVLSGARWVVGSISISVPDITNQFRKTFFGVDNAVTVGNITVFSKSPGQDYHWWAHELQHQVQYHNWGIDNFAYQYVTSCHTVETEAENKAQQAVPVTNPVGLVC